MHLYHFHLFQVLYHVLPIQRVCLFYHPNQLHSLLCQREVALTADQSLFAVPKQPQRSYKVPLRRTQILNVQTIYYHMESDKDLIEKLMIERKKIDHQITQIVSKSYSKYGMSDVVKDDNPYSRLMALKKMGIVENYGDVKLKSVLIVGVGGIGSVASEMLTRCGIGKLILYDYDKVELANMNRLFFTPSQIGCSKVQAAKQTLSAINPDIVIEAYDMNITTQEGYQHVKDRIQHGSLTNESVDLVMSCVDNYSARMTVNSICNKINQIWFQSGVSESALSGHIQILVPGETGCFGCASPLAVSEGTEGTIKREGVCAASLPTTMGIIAGFLCQAALKFLLNFGTLSHCLSYNALSDFFTSYKIAINKECKEPSCQQNQRKKQKGQLAILIGKVEREKKQKEAAVHKSNEWGIEIVISSSKQQQKPANIVKVGEEQKLEDLMAELKAT